MRYSFYPILLGCCFLVSCSFFAPNTLKDGSVSQLMKEGLVTPFFSQLTSSEQNKALLSEYKALEYGKIHNPMAWSSFFGGAKGTVLAGPEYRVGKELCRQYSHDLTINNKSYALKGSACRNLDGSWSLLK